MNLKPYSANDIRLSAIEALCEKSLYEFVKRAWNQIDSTTFVNDWYIGVICEYLEYLFFSWLSE